MTMVCYVSRQEDYMEFMARSSMRYVPWKDRKAVVRNLKKSMVQQQLKQESWPWIILKRLV
jgi:hypothetical protein